MRDNYEGAKDGGITGADFRKFNASDGGKYAEASLQRYIDAALGGKRSFEYGPGGSNLKVTNYSPDSLEVEVFDDNNFDNATLSEEEKKTVGFLRLLLGNLIGTGGKHVKRNFKYKIAKKDVSD